MITLQRSTHLHDQIHDVLWEKILQGEILPGQRLKDTEWAKELGVSRTPVREALRKMQQEGVLTGFDHGGHQVLVPTNDDLRGLFRCRAALEVEAVRGAAVVFTAEDTKHFRQLIKETGEAINEEDFGAVFDLNSRFHRDLINRSHNRHLINLWETLNKLILFYRASLLNRVRMNDESRKGYLDRMKTMQKEHRAIISALSSKDGEKAINAISDHVNKAADHIENNSNFY